MPKGLDKQWDEEEPLRTWLCLRCKHLKKGFPYKCNAFPAEIPHEITFEDFDHRKPFKGDQGIRFEPI